MCSRYVDLYRAHSYEDFRSLYRLDPGIADGMSIARGWTCRMDGRGHFPQLYPQSHIYNLSSCVVRDVRFPCPHDPLSVVIRRFVCSRVCMCACTRARVICAHTRSCVYSVEVLKLHNSMHACE